MPQITRERCRQVLTDGIDKVLNHRFLSWLSNEQNAVLNGCRATIVQDDTVVDKIVANVGPYSQGAYGSLDVKVALMSFVDAASRLEAGADDPMYSVERLIRTGDPSQEHTLMLRFGSGYLQADKVLVHLDGNLVGEFDAAAVEAFVDGKLPTQEGPP